MKIGIDVRSLENGTQHRGIGRYATQLLQALSKIDHRNEYIFFVSHKTVQIPKFDFHESFKHSHDHGRKSFARNTKYIRILYVSPKPLSIDPYGLDVFFHIDNMQPIKFKSTPVVTVLYDLIPYIYKDIYQYVPLGNFTPFSLIAYVRLKAQWAIINRRLAEYKRSSKIISISEHSKRDLLKFFPEIKPNKVVAIPLGPSIIPEIKHKLSRDILKLQNKKFVFYVGGADPRKGLVKLVNDFNEVWKSYPDTLLVLAGKEVIDEDVPETRNLIKAIKESDHPKQIIRFGFVSDPDMNWLYKNAVCYAFPSIYEGFGLPILEAMNVGCPVICYDNSSLPEVAGNAALVVPDGNSLSPAIIRLLSNEKIRKSLIAKGYKQASLFTWDKTAKETLKVLETVGKKK